MLLPMSPADSMFLIGETREQPMHVGGLELFDPPEGADAFDTLNLFRDLLGETDVTPVFSRRPRRSLTTGGLWGWETDRHIDLEHHVRHGGLPRPGRILELLALVSRLHGTLLDRTRPLWEMQLIEGLGDGRLAIYTKVHHSVMDGVSSMHSLQRSLSPDPDVAFVPPWAPPREPRRRRAPRSGPSSAIDQVSTTLDAAAHLAANTAGIAPALAKTVLRGIRAQAAPLSFSAPRTMLNVSISGARRFAAQDWPIERMKQIAKAADVTINDVVLAMCAGALRRYLIGFDALPDAPLIAMVPVSLREEQGSGRQGNAIGLVMCNLGTQHADAADRLAAVHASMVEGKQTLAQMTPLQILAMSALGMGPVAVNLVLPLQDYARPPFNVVISNVPGPTEPLYLNGARMSGLYPLSIPFQGQALNITCTSYADVIGFGLTGDRRALPHLQRLLGYLDDELGALEQAAGVA